MNVFYVYLVRFILVAVYGITLIKINKAKMIDKSLKIKLDFISTAELLLVVLVNLTFFVIPIPKINVIYGTVMSNVMIIVTYFHLRRLMFVGKKILYFRENSFLISDVSHFKYEAGRLSFRIKNHPFKVMRPLTHLEYVLEVMSRTKGRRIKK